MRVLLVTPPMTQFNAPYAATPALAGFLRSRGVDVSQADLSLELALRLFSRRGVEALARQIRRSKRKGRPLSPSVRFFEKHAARYAEAVEPVIRFLQGLETAPAFQIIGRTFLPEGPRFDVLRRLAAPESMDELERAKFYASLFIDDLADVIRDGIDPRFELSRYAEKIAASAPLFEPIRDSLERHHTLVDRLIERLSKEVVAAHRPRLVGITVPFPGNLYGALRVARSIKAFSPRTKVALGGGYINTELRSLAEPALFDYVDYVVLDDGEMPLWCLVEHLGGKRTCNRLKRTFVRERGRVVLKNGAVNRDVPHGLVGAPSYRGLDLDRYVSMCEMPNPMHRMWSDGRWNRIVLAHGCYWKKCAFCDTCLDYIRRFDPAPAKVLVDRIEAVIKETGRTEFHFVDEAAPPALLGRLCDEILGRDLEISWWCNIRFEEAFTSGLISKMASSGCVAVTAGLESVVGRLLRLMDKGYDARLAARIAGAFADAGILVHAYLMYGFPTQTEQETVDALEIVRQLFREGCLHSAYWHRFALTVHSPMARRPERFGIRLRPAPQALFARNEIPYDDPSGCDHGRFGFGLRKAVYNFMLGIGVDADVRSWFDFKAPRTRVRKDFVSRVIKG